jgi:hypothetical protein
MSEHSPIRHHDPSEGFDRTEPNVLSIWGFTIGSIVVLIVMMVALQQYFVKIWNDAVYEKVLIAPDQQFQMVHNRDDWDLTHYTYVDQKAGVVRIPVEKAMDSFLKEVAAGKPFYPGKATVPKKEEPAPAAPGAPGAPAAAAGSPGAAPAPAAEAKKAGDTKK